MQLGLVYLGFILLLGAFYLYTRYEMKKMNNKIFGILELTNTLAQEMEEINKVSNFLGKKIDNGIDENVVDTNGPQLQVISDDESEDDESEDDESEDDDERVVKELVNEEIIIETKEIVDVDDMKSSIVEEEMKTLIIEEMIEEKTDIEKMTVSELKLKIKEKNPTIKLTNLKRNELLNILKDE